MIGPGLKKYGISLGFLVQSGVAHGPYRGYYLTFSEGMGYKRLAIAVRMPSEDARLQMLGFLNDPGLKKTYRITAVSASLAFVCVDLYDTIGTMERFKGFVDVVCGRLLAMQVPSAGVCNVCGAPLGAADGGVFLYNGVAYPMHTACSNRLYAAAAEQHEELKAQGNLALGILGAFVGAFVGSIPWIAGMSLGWFVGIFALFIGMGALKGYELLGGPNTKAKGFAVIAAVAVMVPLAQYLTMVIAWVLTYMRYGVEGITFVQIMEYMHASISSGDETPGIIANLGIGIFFAALACAGPVSAVFRRTGEQGAVPKRLR